ncbi:MAG TPA: hypothetical protein VN845_08150 [Solirubrobacteraceae bacterium]|nr:hypothetical protein [Solirubrobacteraceae bacterium]
MSIRTFIRASLLACVLLAAGLFAAPVASASTGIPVALGFLGFPSIQSIVEGIVNFFFQDVATALVPSFLKNASVATIKWLVAVPDPASWTHIGELEGDMTLLAVSLLGVCFTAGIVRYLLVGLSGSGHPLQALASTVGSAGALILYPWAATQVVAMINTLTNTILSFPVVGNGLQRTVGILFGGALLIGSGGLFLAVLVIVGVVFATVMFVMKVLILLAFALLYVVGPLVIAVRPLPELSHLVRAWGTMLIGVALVPVGWTILFAVAGALSLDATSFGGVGHVGVVGALTGHVAGAFAALLTFFLAMRLPLGVLGHLRGVLGGTSSPTRAGSTGGGGGSAGVQVSDANARLRAGTLQAGRVVGLAAGALGAPAGGMLGAGTRAAGRLRAPVASAAMHASAPLGERTRGTRSRLSSSRVGEALARSPRARKTRERVAAAALVLSESPALVRDAAARAHAKTHTPGQDTAKGRVEGRSDAVTREGARRAPKRTPRTQASTARTDRTKSNVDRAEPNSSGSVAQQSRRRESGSGSREAPVSNARAPRPKASGGSTVASKPRPGNTGSTGASRRPSSLSGSHSSSPPPRKQARVDGPVSGVSSTSRTQRKPNRKPKSKAARVDRPQPPGKG